MFLTRTTTALALSVQVLMLLAAPALAAQVPDQVPDPDGKSADMRKPVQVYILMGQSNMLGFGKVKGDDGSLEHAVKEKSLYPHLVDDEGNWTVRQDVRNVRVMGSGTGGMRQFNNEFMTITGGNIGPEIGIGHHVGHATKAPVMVLKSCIGNRSLGWDMLPPGSEQYEYEGKIYAGYKESPDAWDKGAEPVPIGWYAGMQYDGDVARGRETRTATTLPMPASTRKTSCGSSSSCARTSRRPRRTSSWPRLDRRRRAPRVTRA